MLALKSDSHEESSARETLIPKILDGAIFGGLLVNYVVQAIQTGQKSIDKFELLPIKNHFDPSYNFQACTKCNIL